MNARCLGVPLAALVATAASPAAPIDLTEGGPADTEPFLRVADAGQRVALEIACRDYVQVAGEGPRVGLIAVAHLGDARFYKALQQKLATYDVVLFESVLPAGALPPVGDDDQERRASTRASLQLIAGLLESHRGDRGVYPPSLGGLTSYLDERDPRAAEWAISGSTDAWGNPVHYLHEAAPADRFVVCSYGADAAPGGDGARSDVIVSSADGIPPLELESGDRLQAQLADVLGLSFQLDQMDYGGDNWRCADMSMDQIDRAMTERGLDFAPFAGTLAGSSLPAQLVKVMLRLVKFFDVFLGGSLADTFKVVLIEVLGDESLVDQSMAELGPGFEEVIVDMRNQVAIDRLARIAADEPKVKSVAIFYGAAHMPDMVERLAEAGYALDGDATDWFRAIEVDLARSAVTKSDVEQIRGMLKQWR